MKAGRLTDMALLGVTVVGLSATVLLVLFICDVLQVSEAWKDYVATGIIFVVCCFFTNESRRALGALERGRRLASSARAALATAEVWIVAVFVRRGAITLPLFSGPFHQMLAVLLVGLANVLAVHFLFSRLGLSGSLKQWLGRVDEKAFRGHLLGLVSAAAAGGTTKQWGATTPHLDSLGEFLNMWFSDLYRSPDGLVRDGVISKEERATLDQFGAALRAAYPKGSDLEQENINRLQDDPRWASVVASARQAEKWLKERGSLT